jgi:type II secretory pathway pseudopilin PulG
VDVPARAALAIILAIIATLAAALIPAWRRWRRENAARAETQRRAHRRTMLTGRRDPSEESAETLSRPQELTVPRALPLLRSLIIGTVTGVAAFFALPAGGTEVSDQATQPDRPVPTITAAAAPRASSPRPTPVDASPIPTGSAQVASTEPTPGPSPGASAAAASSESLVIANTGGRGVWVRAACSDAARTSQAWAEGRLVQSVAAEEPECGGWRLVEAEGVRSWVEERYLESAGER